jgi:hypothetical protein
MLVFGLTPAEACQSRALLSPVVWLRVITWIGYDLGRYLLLRGVFLSYLYIARLNLRDPATTAYCKVPTITIVILLYRIIAKAIVSELNLSQASICGHLWVRSVIFWWHHQILSWFGWALATPRSRIFVHSCWFAFIVLLSVWVARCLPCVLLLFLLFCNGRTSTTVVLAVARVF